MHIYVNDIDLETTVELNTIAVHQFYKFGPHKMRVIADKLGLLGNADDRDVFLSLQMGERATQLHASVLEKYPAFLLQIGADITVDVTDKYKQEVVLVTPALAKKWYDDRRPNRTVSKHTVDSYAALMAEDQWFCAPFSSISFDSNNRCCDGQHRLLSVIKSGKTVKMYVYREIPDIIIDNAIDFVRSRSTSDRLGMNGDVTNRVKTATVRLAILAALGTYPKLSLGLFNDVVDHVEEKHLNVVCALPLKKIPATLRAVLLIARPLGQRKIDRLSSNLSNRLSESDAEGALLHLLLNLHRYSKLHKLQQMKMFAKGVTAYLRGDDLLTIKKSHNGLDVLFAMRAKAGLSVTLMSDKFYQMCATQRDAETVATESIQ